MKIVENTDVIKYSTEIELFVYNHIHKLYIKDPDGFRNGIDYNVIIINVRKFASVYLSDTELMERIDFYYRAIKDENSDVIITMQKLIRLCESYKTKEQMTEEIEALICHETIEEDCEVQEVNVSVDNVTVSPSVSCEPEDAIWYRDLSDIFDAGVKIGIASSIKYFKGQN